MKLIQVSEHVCTIVVKNSAWYQFTKSQGYLQVQSGGVTNHNNKPDLGMNSLGEDWKPFMEEMLQRVSHVKERIESKSYVGDGIDFGYHLSAD
jgi:hypothetical protein